jgi:hypothetical protein
VVSQGPEDRPGGGEETVLAGSGCELGEARAEHEAALHVARDEAVVLERDGEAVRRRPGKAGRTDELGEGRRTRLEGAQDGGRLVENPDST